MRASLSIMKWTGGTEKDLREIGTNELIRLATNRLGGLESYEEYGRRFEGIVVARVVSCEPHPDSDHLHVCMIDAGGANSELATSGSGFIQVVCGAPNVREGLTVAWIPPGATVPSSHDEAEPFVLGKREIRGVMSNGMIASPKELGISEDHDGILEINLQEMSNVKPEPGLEFSKLYGLEDLLLDFENKMFTHRPDCFGQIGLARELAGIQGLKYTSPDWYRNVIAPQKTSKLEVTSKNEVPDKVHRFMLQVVEGLSVQPSPIWLQAYLTRVGIRPINNIVDWSNYYMHLTAQPTHAFDYEKLKKVSGLEKPEVYPRMATEGEELALLNGKTIKLTPEDIVISCGDKAVAFAGLMGGAETEVDENTTSIVIECATFDMYTVRRSMMRHGIFTDAAIRYTKGQSPLQNDRVLAKIGQDLVDFYGAKLGMVYDSGAPEVSFMNSIFVTPQYINARLGTKLSAKDIRQILENVEIGVEVSAEELVVTPPFWRTDLELKEDIVEEVGRLFGFDQLELKLPKRSTRPAPKNELLEFKSTLRHKLASSGANEVLSYSFVHGDLLRKTGVEDVEKWAIHIRNAISPDLQYYRTSLVPSLLTKVHPNLKSDMVRSDDNEFALFEIGKAQVRGHDDEEGLPAEFERLSFVFAADEKTATRKYHGPAFYQAKKYLNLILEGQAELRPLENNDYPICSPYQIGRSAMVYVGGELLGVIGELRGGVKKSLKLPDFCAGFELDINLLMQKLRPSSYEPIGTYPKTQQDITLRVSKEVSYEALKSNIWQKLTELRTEKGYDSSLGPRDIFQKDDEDTQNVTFRLWLWHPEKTLKTEEVNELLNTLTDNAKKALGAERV
ncbi:phenylalanine--tRNA ligase subunit beta [Candidatus Saccharibacteria bacterium]|nr:phenylalanine--tRNA ligase subunit beta [Candidatus Saccharibacteria bacterium]